MDYLDKVDSWLESKGVTLWQSWNISDPVQRRAAAVWFVNQQDEFDRWDQERPFKSALAYRWDVV